MVKVLEKLKSRKFWLTFAGGVVILFAKQLGFDVDPEQLWQLASIVTGYNLAEAHVDAKRLVAAAATK